MTLSTSTASQTFPGNGVTQIFPCGFRIFQASDISVSLVNQTTGTSTALVLNSDYTLVGEGNQTGFTLSTSTPVANGTNLLVARNIAYTQPTDFTNQGSFFPTMHEDCADRLGMQIQQLAGGIDRSLQLPDGLYPAASSTLPLPSPLAPIVWNASGTGLENGSTSMSGDLLLRGNLADSAANKGSSLVTFMPPDPNGLAQAVSVAIGGGIPVTWYATSAQLAIDATTATTAAIAYAYSSGRKLVYFPGGLTYKFPAASASIDPGNGDISFYGDGSSSVIAFEEGTGVGDINTLRKSLFRNNTTTAKGKLEFRNLNFQGTWSTKSWVEGGGAVMFLNYYDTITITGCTFENLSWMAMANEYIQNVRVMGNTFNKVCRDMCRFRSSFNVQVIGNRFSHGDDDAVALHSSSANTPTQIREGIVVADNVFEDVPAIQILGGRMVNVHHNILRRCKSSGIFVYTAAGVASEASNSVFGVSICDNQIYDQLTRAPFTTANAQCIAVYSRPAQGSTATGSVIPGRIVTATGTAILPWTQRNGRYDATSPTEAVPSPQWVRIQNNTIARTLPAVAAYSTWGYGQTHGATGPTDPAVTDTALRPTHCMQLDGDQVGAIVSGNQASHFANGFVSLSAATSDFALERVDVTHNQVSDCMGALVYTANPAAPKACLLSVTDNTFDGDPYFLSSNRFSSGGVFNGTWIANTTPSLIGGTNYYGISVERNRISNVAQVVNNGGSTNVEVHRNVLRCQPAAEGFSTSNKGIGNCPAAGEQYRYELFASDPSLSTYRQIINTMQQISAAMPTTGTYVHGTFVQSVSGSTVMGWYRLTTGSAHVSGTDWKTVALT